MRLIKCRKCGATICTEETMQERILDAIEELNERARKDRKNASSYLQQAASYKKLLTQILHRTAQYDSDLRRIRNEQKVLVSYVLQNGLVSHEKLNELEKIARERSAENDKKDAEEIERLYGCLPNPLINKTKGDPTARKAGVK